MPKNKERAYELDLLRGIAIIMMMYQHFSYDMRYEFGVDAFSYQEKDWFWAFVHPVILILFVGLSGICCTFSRNNLKRGAKLLLVALLFTGFTYAVTEYFGVFCLVIFNVLHLLALGILLYWLICVIEKKTHVSSDVVTFIMAAAGVYIIILNGRIHDFDMKSHLWLLIPTGVRVIGEPSVADHLTLVPWLGVFLLGAVLGRTVYKERKSLFPEAAAKRADKDAKSINVFAPLEFLGRHSLIIYLVHQPLMYGVLYVIFKIMGKS